MHTEQGSYTDIERCVCRVEWHSVMATGFLIGRGVVLIPSHILPGNIESGEYPEGLAFRFDYRLPREGEGAAPDSPVFYPAKEWLIDWDRALDYAVLRLDGELAGRGWLNPIVETVEPGSALILLHHAGGGPLKLTRESNAVVSMDREKQRLVYRVSSEPVSAGAPVLNEKLELVAMHLARSADQSYGAPTTAIRRLWLEHSETRLYTALNTFDWTRSDELVHDMTRQITQSEVHYDAAFPKRVMGRLRRKRRFSAMTRLGDALVSMGGADTAQVRRQYAQALIDQGIYHAADQVLGWLLSDPATAPIEKEEACGLRGRISKQIYVNADLPRGQVGPIAVTHLQAALDAYWETYTANPGRNTWHGINVVALLSRAAADRVKLKTSAESEKVANDILEVLGRRKDESNKGELDVWDTATAMEAHLALGDTVSALQRARAYAEHLDADAFEIASSLRQLEDVWRLRDDTEPGSRILPILRAALLRREGGVLQLSALVAKSNLEKVFADDRSVTLEWYRLGLERARSVARIELDGKGCGTGWLVDSQEFFPNGSSRMLLLTNAHVIGPDRPDRYPTSLRPEDATVHFQMQNEKMQARRVIFHSPANEQDAVFLELSSAPANTDPLPLDFQMPSLTKSPARLYSIGHPGGRDIEFSLQDNHMLDVNERLIHYRTPTECGSSGSPVFGPVGWKVIALHHAGSRELKRLDNSRDTYEANEGILVSAIRAETQRLGTCRPE